MKAGAVVALLLLASKGFAGELVEVLSSRSALVGGGGSRTAHFEASRDQAYQSFDELRLLDVVQGGFSLGDHERAAFSVVWADGGIDLKIETDQLSQGPYTVRSRAQATLPDGGVGATTLSFELLIAPATVSLDASKLRVRESWSLSGWPEDGGRFVLREGSQRSRARAIVSSEPEGATNGTDNFDRALLIEPVSLDAGQTLSVGYHLAPEVGLGKTTGKLKLASRDLAADVVVDYEIIRRVEPPWILAVVLLGCFAGYLTRTVLARAVEKLRRREELARLIIEVERQLVLHPDAEYQRRVSTSLTALKTLPPDDAEAVDSLLKATHEELSAAVADIGTRRPAAVALLVKLRSHLGTGGTLPKAVSEALAVLAAPVASAALVLERDEVAQAQAILEAAQKNLSSQLAAAAEPFCDEATALIDAVAVRQLPFASAGPKAGFAAAQKALDELGKAEAEPGTKLERFWDALRALRALVQELFRGAATATATVLEYASGLTTEERRQLDAAVTKLQAVAREPWAEALAQGSLLSNVTQQLRTALERLVTAAASPAALKALLDAGNFVDLAKALPRQSASAGTALGGTKAGDPALTGRIELGAIGWSPFTQVVPNLGTGHVTPVAPPFAGQSRWSRLGKMVDVRWLQTGVVWFFVAMAACVSFESTFGYSYKDIFSVFAWAFGLDLASAGLVATYRTVGSTREKQF